MKKITTDRALRFSATILLIYIIISEVQLFLGIQPDMQLTIAVFATFGVAEGGYCTYIHRLKKKDEEESDNESVTG